MHRRGSGIAGSKTVASLFTLIVNSSPATPATEAELSSGGSRRASRSGAPEANEAESWALPFQRLSIVISKSLVGKKYARWESRVRSAVRGGKYGIRRRHAAQRLHASVYTQVYTSIENSGRLGPPASERPQHKTASIRRFCPALST